MGLVCATLVISTATPIITSIISSTSQESAEKIRVQNEQERQRILAEAEAGKEVIKDKLFMNEHAMTHYFDCINRFMKILDCNGNLKIDREPSKEEIDLFVDLLKRIQKYIVALTNVPLGDSCYSLAVRWYFFRALVKVILDLRQFIIDKKWPFEIEILKELYKTFNPAPDAAYYPASDSSQDYQKRILKSTIVVEKEDRKFESRGSDYVFLWLSDKSEFFKKYGMVILTCQSPLINSPSWSPKALTRRNDYFLSEDSKIKGLFCHVEEIPTFDNWDRECTKWSLHFKENGKLGISSGSLFLGVIPKQALNKPHHNIMVESFMTQLKEMVMGAYWGGGLPVVLTRNFVPHGWEGFIIEHRSCPAVIIKAHEDTFIKHNGNEDWVTYTDTVTYATLFEIVFKSEFPYFSISNVSSNCYLDGRAPGMHDCYVSSPGLNPENNKYYRWQILQIPDTSLVKIWSFSSRQWLDGRCKIGDEAFLSTKDPQVTLCLQWELRHISGDTYAFKSISSGCWLDGSRKLSRRPVLTDAHRNPSTDVHLQFRIKKL